jgi:ferric iron reductase protein FhuF
VEILTEHAELQRCFDVAIAGLGRFGAAFPVFIAPPEGLEIVGAREALDPKNLRSYCARSITEWSDAPELEDVRAAAARFFRRYAASVATAALVPLWHGVAVDVSLPRVRLVIRDEMPKGVVLHLTNGVTATGRRSNWPITMSEVGSVEELQTCAFASLFADNLVPAFALARQSIPVPARLLWSLAAEQIDFLYEGARAAGLGDANAAIEHDRWTLLHAPSIPGCDGPNPMVGLLDWEETDDPDFPRPLQVRKVCCRSFVISGRDGPCRTCPDRTSSERLHAWRRWKASTEDLSNDLGIRYH